MNESQKKALIVVRLILLFHFSLLFVYCFPDGWMNEKIRVVANAYANPLFQGRWNLFAPEVPKEHKSLIYRFKEEEDFSPWLKLTEGVQQRHDAIRIGASTKMYHVLQNGSHYLWEFYYQNESARDSVKLINMQHLLIQKIKDEYELVPQEIQMALVLNSSPNFETGEWGTDTLDFNAFTLE